MDDLLFNKSRENELLQLIGKFLSNKGFNQAYEQLKKDSGLSLEHHSATLLRTAISEGNWEEAEKCLSQLSKMVEYKFDEVMFLLLEQQFLEFLEDGEVIQAINILRNRLTPLNINRDRIHLLASCLMCRTNNELMIQAGSWLGKNNGSRQILMEKIQKFIPANAMLPSHRLEGLIYSGIEFQIKNCLFHNIPDLPENFSLLVPHRCSLKDFPCHVSQRLKVNDSEIWMCKFSPNGKFLAIGGKEQALEIYSVNLENHKVRNHLTLSIDNHQSFITWSPDSKKLAVCYGEEQSSISVCDPKNGAQICVQKVNDEDSYTAAAFFSDSRKLAFGGIKGTFYVIDTEDNGRILTIVEGYRVQAMVAIWPNVSDEERSFEENYFSISQELIKDLPPGAPDSSYNGSSSQKIITKNFPSNFNPQFDYLLVADSMHRVGLFVFGNKDQGSAATLGHSMTSLASQNPHVSNTQSSLQPFINLSLVDNPNSISNLSSIMGHQTQQLHLQSQQQSISRRQNLSILSPSSMARSIGSQAQAPGLSGLPLLNAASSSFSRHSVPISTSNLLLMSPGVGGSENSAEENMTQYRQPINQPANPHDVIRTSDDPVESGVVRLFNTYRLEFQDSLPPLTTASHQNLTQARTSTNTGEGSSLMAMNLSLLASQMTTDTPSTAAIGSVTTATLAEDDEQSHESESNSTGTSIERNNIQTQQNSQYSLQYHKTLFSEQYPIQSLSLSSDGTKLLICVHKMGLHLWDLKSSAIIDRFVGAKQELLRLFPVLGGYNDSFISMGSEDGKIYFWRIDNGSQPIHVMNGVNPQYPLYDMNKICNSSIHPQPDYCAFNSDHTNGKTSSNVAVNCVSWNPCLPSMLASVNDDGEVIIWTSYDHADIREKMVS